MIWLAACATDPEPAPVADTTAPVYVPTCDPGMDLPDPVITSAELTCEEDVLHVVVEVEGWTGTGRLVVADLGADPLVVELQPVETTSYDPCATWDHLEVHVPAGASTWAMGASTAFSCADYADGLTFALWVTRWIDEEALADCVSWGATPEAVAEGALDGAIPEDLAPPEGLGTCRPLAG